MATKKPSQSDRFVEWGRRSGAQLKMLVIGAIAVAIAWFVGFWMGIDDTIPKEACESARVAAVEAATTGMISAEVCLEKRQAEVEKARLGMVSTETCRVEKKAAVAEATAGSVSAEACRTQWRAEVEKARRGMVSTETCQAQKKAAVAEATAGSISLEACQAIRRAAIEKARRGMVSEETCRARKPVAVEAAAAEKRPLSRNVNLAQPEQGFRMCQITRSSAGYVTKCWPALEFKEIPGWTVYQPTFMIDGEQFWCSPSIANLAGLPESALPAQKTLSCSTTRPSGK